MHAVTTIGHLMLNKLPTPSSIEHFFVDYSEHEWAPGGQSGASFQIYGVDGTDGREPYKDRVDLSLGVYDHPQFGMYLHYSKTGGGFGEHFFSLGDVSRLSEMVENRDGDLLSVGLFVSPATAWLAVKAFISEGGARSDEIRWAAEDDLPPEAFASE